MAPLSLRTLLVLLAVGAAPVFAQAPTRTEAQRDSLYQLHKGDFDYLLGEWKFTSVSKEWGKGRGYWTAVRLPGSIFTRPLPRVASHRLPSASSWMPSAPLSEPAGGSLSLNE